jgi:septum formation protein
VRQTRPLMLASASPRRREILGNLGLSFRVQAADLDETRRDAESPSAYVARLSRDKARAVALLQGAFASDATDATDASPRAQHGALALLGADTTVVLDEQVLEKPRDLADSERMLRALRGREHVVYTAVTLLLWPEDLASTQTVATRVRFRAFDDTTLRGYVASREGMDKAGSYGIQELGAALVSEVHGSYSNVVGLPAAETLELLERHGVVVEWP